MPVMWQRCVPVIRKVGYVECNRWSIVVPFLFYVALFLFTRTLSFPLKSPSFHEKKVPQILENTDRHYVGASHGSQLNIKDPRVLLENIFTQADKDTNKLLSIDELSACINDKIQDHISEALKENFGQFNIIDENPRNGLISWDEYHHFFLKQRGLLDTKVMARADKEYLMRERAAWSEAARADPDHLTLDEFLAFRHPESSHANLLTLVDDLLDKFDRDGDELLTEEEFSGLEAVVQKKGEEDRRRLEYRLHVDLDNDGKADRRELLRYIDPTNPRHARIEAETLLSLADTNNDQQLSLMEILSKMGLFLGSKMVDTAGSFHDEF